MTEESHRMAHESNRMISESNQLHSESVVISRRLTEINVDASRHSKQAAASALRSLVTAEDMSRSTRVNVQVCMATHWEIAAH